MFNIYKKIPEILLGNFRSVRTVCVIYHLPKISGLSRRASLDSSYNMKLVRNSRNLLMVNEFPFETSQSEKRDYLFRISVCPGRGGTRGRVQGVRTPPPPRPNEMTCGFQIQLVFCQKKKLCGFIGVEVEQETSAPPPKKKSWIRPCPGIS